jgi:hypothetical protein
VASRKLRFDGFSNRLMLTEDVSIDYINGIRNDFDPRVMMSPHQISYLLICSVLSMTFRPAYVEVGTMATRTLLVGSHNNKHTKGMNPNLYHTTFAGSICGV